MPFKLGRERSLGVLLFTLMCRFLCGGVVFGELDRE